MQLPLVDRFTRWLGREPELALLPALCDPVRGFLDVGANLGRWARVGLRHAARTHAIEPLPALAAGLRRRFGARVDVHELALGAVGGTAPLFVPEVDGARITTRSSLESDANRGLAQQPIEVRVARLDELGLPPLGAIKIDVEGHELGVLIGGTETIARDRPAMIVEIEERHAAGATERAFAWLGARGYAGWFLHAGRPVPVDRFDPARHQRAEHAKPPGRGRAHAEYVNNFVFVHDDDRRARAALFARQ